jgi:hypothetical protein
VIRDNVVLNTLSACSTSTLLRDQICIDSPSSWQVPRPSRTVLRDRLQFLLYAIKQYALLSRSNVWLINGKNHATRTASLAGSSAPRRRRAWHHVILPVASLHSLLRSAAPCTFAARIAPARMPATFPRAVAATHVRAMRPRVAIPAVPEGLGGLRSYALSIDGIGTSGARTERSKWN